MSESNEERENPLRAEKRRKLADLRATGIDPFPHNFERNSLAANLFREFDSKLEVGQTLEGTHYRIAGRVMTKRPMGKAAFFNIQDGSGSIQVYLRKEELSAEDNIAFDHLDLGDFVGLSGFVFKTKKGELSLHAKEFK
ncbi:MAG: OB-fold nucleic acid binding domain-containing protein, partial [Bdellovibrionota bacterium]